MSKIRKIPFIDLSLKKSDSNRTAKGISKLIENKNFIGGEEVLRFRIIFLNLTIVNIVLGLPMELMP